MLVRTDDLIKQAESMSDNCCFKKQLIEDLKSWKRSLLRSMDRRLNNTSLDLPVGIRDLGKDVDGQAFFTLQPLIGNDIYNFTLMEVNSRSFFTNTTNANETLFHELSHISGTIDETRDTPASALWNAHIIDDFIGQPSNFKPIAYFNLLKQDKGIGGCSISDRKWPN